MAELVLEPLLIEKFPAPPVPVFLEENATPVPFVSVQMATLLLEALLSRV